MSLRAKVVPPLGEFLKVSVLYEDGHLYLTPSRIKERSTPSCHCRQTTQNAAEGHIGST